MYMNEMKWLKMQHFISFFSIDILQVTLDDEVWGALCKKSELFYIIHCIAVFNILLHVSTS